MSGTPWPSDVAGALRGGDQQDLPLLPPAPRREDRSQQRIQALRRTAWSKALSEYLRGDLNYAWVPVTQVLAEFRISRATLDGITLNNERMTVRSTSVEVDGVNVVTEEIKGNRSTRPRSSGSYRSLGS